MTRSLSYAAFFVILGPLQAAENILLADFEGSSYAPWKVEGAAFGDAPARGTLPGQQEISGYKGKGLVSSYVGKDASKGKLESPEFTIDRKFITFLIGGGGWKGETCLNLVIDGKTVRSATGRNILPGGSEKLSPAHWEVGEFSGRQARIVIVDDREGGWGHINVDDIVLTDDKGSIPKAIDGYIIPPQITRTTKVTGDFLQLPLIRNPDRSEPGFQKLSVVSDGKVVRYQHVKFPQEGSQPDLWVSMDVRELKGREIRLEYASADKPVLDRLEFGDKEHVDSNAYDGPHRPRFHFSPRLGWMNDINGTYHHDGLYHLFYQYNPAGTVYGAGFDMHWGHSVSRDLMHWEEQPIALFPDGTGQVYSGTTVMQHSPVPGLNEGVKLPAPVIFFTGTDPIAQHLATTPDSGKTWKRFPGNPVLPKMGDRDRDPKVIWHEPSGHYVMVLYVDGSGDTYRFLRSKDLLEWETTSEIAGWYECPEFFPVTSPTTGEKLMLLYGCYRGKPEGSGEPVNLESCYQLGRFDGKTFTPVSEIRPAHLGPNFYGALIYANEPNGRNVMMGWARRTKFPDEPFNQCATVPLEMKVRAIDGKDTLCYEPAEEVVKLRGEPLIKERNISPTEANQRLGSIPKDAPVDVVVRFAAASGSTAVDVTLRGIHFHHDPSKKLLSRNGSNTPLHAGSILETRFLIDRGIVEAFWNGGEAAYSIASLHTDEGPSFRIDGDVTIEELTVYPMSDIWKTRKE